MSVIARYLVLSITFFAIFALTSPAHCKSRFLSAPPEQSGVQNADWVENAVLYQINTRQFTPEGTINAARQQLPRLKELGVDILWLMPVQPIGIEKRKGSLGSPYSISNYTDVNPELGSLEDMKGFVEEAHSLGMKVILDWVANHTAWDNPLITEHPDWYTRDWRGNMQPPPSTDWSDVADLNYDNPDLRRYMTGAMKFWVEEMDFDGFRCDVAGMVPLDFWETARAELEKIKPVFMLAEWEQRDLHIKAFDASYAWTWNNTMHDIALGKANAGAMKGHYFFDEANTWPRSAIRMRYVSNHDQNTWEATQFERFGDGLKAAIVLSFTGTGIPLLYNGQEAGNTDRLEFFERDPIVWREHEIGDLYKSLIKLKHETTALWNGVAGTPMVYVENSEETNVFAFTRTDKNGGIFAIFNMSGQDLEVTLKDGPYVGSYTDFFTGKLVSFEGKDTLTLVPWDVRLFVRR